MKKTNAVLLGVVATALLVGGVGALSAGFKKWDYYNWFEKKSNYEKKLDEWNVKKSLIDLDELTFDKENGVISCNAFAYIKDSLDIVSIEIPNTYGSTYKESYDMKEILEVDGVFDESDAYKIAHYENYVAFRFWGPSRKFKLKAENGNYYDLSVISYATKDLIIPIEETLPSETISSVTDGSSEIK